MVNFDDSNTPESVRHVSPNGIVNTIPIVRCLILPHLELPIVAEATTPIAYLMWTFLHAYWSILGAFHVLHKLRPAHIKQFISPGITLYLHRKGPCYVPILSHHKILWQTSMNTFQISIAIHEQQEHDDDFEIVPSAWIPDDEACTIQLPTAGWVSTKQTAECPIMDLEIRLSCSLDDTPDDKVLGSIPVSLRRRHALQLSILLHNPFAYPPAHPPFCGSLDTRPLMLDRSLTISSTY